MSKKARRQGGESVDMPKSGRKITAEDMNRILARPDKIEDTIEEEEDQETEKKAEPEERPLF
jgi:hypothetical protein